MKSNKTIAAMAAAVAPHISPSAFTARYAVRCAKIIPFLAI